jgi:hypothetical protein
VNSKHLQASIRKAAGKASTFVATITTDSVDRDGEVVVPAGMNSKDYERNPVLLYEHDVLKPIGKVTPATGSPMRSAPSWTSAPSTR